MNERFAFGALIKYRREVLGMKQECVARKAFGYKNGGSARARMSRIENGHVKNLTPQIVEPLIKVLEIEPEQLPARLRPQEAIEELKSTKLELQDLRSRFDRLPHLLKEILSEQVSDGGSSPDRATSHRDLANEYAQAYPGATVAEFVKYLETKNATPNRPSVYAAQKRLNSNQIKSQLLHEFNTSDRQIDIICKLVSAYFGPYIPNPGLTNSQNFFEMFPDKIPDYWTPKTNWQDINSHYSTHALDSLMYFLSNGIEASRIGPESIYILIFSLIRCTHSMHPQDGFLFSRALSDILDFVDQSTPRVNPTIAAATRTQLLQCEDYRKYFFIRKSPYSSVSTEFKNIYGYIERNLRSFDAYRDIDPYIDESYWSLKANKVSLLLQLYSCHPGISKEQHTIDRLLGDLDEIESLVGKEIGSQAALGRIAGAASKGDNISYALQSEQRRISVHLGNDHKMVSVLSMSLSAENGALERSRQWKRFTNLSASQQLETLSTGIFGVSPELRSAYLRHSKRMTVGEFTTARSALEFI